MSQSPLAETANPGDSYLDAFADLSRRIRGGQSFSGDERNCAFINRGGGRFADLSYALGLDLADDGRGLAVADFDADGDPDLCVTNRTAPRLRILRNDLADGVSSVWIRPIGDPAQGCPRDAAGARVVVEVGGVSRFRTVTLGDGFCSQSSKWLHFGLGEVHEIGPVTVRWPGGEEERFGGVVRNQRYVLRQGAGVATVVQPTLSNSKPLAAAAPPVPAPTEAGRIRFSQPLGLPARLSFADLGGQRTRLTELTERGPVLLTLWATWCPPCLAELSEFAQAREKFAAAGLQGLALSVDRIDGDGADTATIVEALRDTGFSGRSGLADTELVSTFERLFEEAIYRHRSFPVPTSFLIDKGGWLTVIYKGKTSAEHVLADTAKLGLGPGVARRESLPFAGRWAEGHFQSHPIAVAAAFHEGGHIADARAHLERFLSDHPVAPGTKLDRKRARQLADVHGRLGEMRRSAGDHRGALNHFKAASHFAPGITRYSAGRVRGLAESGQMTTAREALTALLESSPDSVHVLALSGDLARISGDERSAVEGYEAALAIDPRFVPALGGLSRLLASAEDQFLRDPAAALRHAEALVGVPGAERDARHLATLALACRATGDHARAEHLFRDALDLAKRSGGGATLAEVQALVGEGQGR